MTVVDGTSQQLKNKTTSGLESLLCAFLTQWWKKEETSNAAHIRRINSFGRKYVIRFNRARIKSKEFHWNLCYQNLCTNKLAMSKNKVRSIISGNLKDLLCINYNIDTVKSWA